MIPALLALSLLQQSTPGCFETVLERVGSTGESLGKSLDGGRHLDADGVPDFVVHEGRSIALHSGASGSLLLRIPTNLPSGSDRVLMLGDTDGDGVSEILITDSTARQARIYSGANGALRYTLFGSTITFGVAASVVGDVTGDGIADFLLSDPDARDSTNIGRRGMTSLYSGADGSLVRTHQVEDVWTSSWAGRRVSTARDVDRDGVPDYLIGGPFTDNLRGTCTILSGASGQVIRVLFNPQPSDAGFGISVAFAGDCDRDGIPDQAVTTPFTAGGTRPRIAVFSGASGSLLWETVAPQPYHHGFGAILLGGWDWNGDGAEDLVAGDPDSWFYPWSSGAVHILSGSDGSILASRFDENGGASYPEQLAWFGDLDRDGRPEFGVGTPRHVVGSGSAGGRLQVFSWYPGLKASAASVSAQNGATIHFRIDLPASLAGASYALLASRIGPGPTSYRGVSVPLTPDALLRRCISSPPAALRGSIGILDPRGDGSASLHLPPGVAVGYVGTTVWFAALAGSGIAPVCSTVVQAVAVVP
jgi:hypothetical protein